MRVLLISSTYDGLTQRAHVELEDRGHDVSITLALDPEEMRQAVARLSPNLIICPFLRERLPTDICQNHTAIIVNPGVGAHRGASSVDWAIANGLDEWGVLAWQATEKLGVGEIWASVTVSMRNASKASLYRRELSQAAIRIILGVVERFASGGTLPGGPRQEDLQALPRPTIKQSDRAVDWRADSTQTIIRKINSADSPPGLLDTIAAKTYYLYGAHEEDSLRGNEPGAIIAKRHGAICRATVDGAVWISHLKHFKEERPAVPLWWQLPVEPEYKLPAATLLGQVLDAVPESPIDALPSGDGKTFREICYQELNDVGYLYFDFHNGAMGTEQCRRLREAYRLARQRPTRVIVLMGGEDIWSNGIHLNLIEAASDPAAESWRNLNAINDLVRDIITTDSHLTVSALRGNAGAGGAIMALAADRVCARAGCILNPHYKSMGLYGSEYWTYLLPRRVGPTKALELTQTPLPIGMSGAQTIGLIDDILSDNRDTFGTELAAIAENMAHDPDFQRKLQDKRELRDRDEQIKPLAWYRAVELKQMKMNFSGQFLGGDQNYHKARHDFVYKVRPDRTPDYLATHLRFDGEQFKELRQPPGS